jgi:hypothetical protein
MKMKKQNQHENTEQPSPVEDLTITQDQEAEIKGGPLCHGVSVIAYARVDGPSL